MKTHRLIIIFALAVLPIVVILAVFSSNPAHADETLRTDYTASDAGSLALSSSNAFSSVVPIGYNFPIVLDKGKEIQGKPAVAFDGTNFLVVWIDLANYDIYGARVALDGTVLDPDAIPISVSLNDLARQPSVAFDGVNFFVAWCATRAGAPEVYAARVTSDGSVLDPQGIKLTTGSDALDRMPGVAFDGTNYLVVWRTTSTSIHAARVTTAGINLDAPAGFPIAVSGVSKYPAVAFDGNNYLVVWHKSVASTGDDIYGARVTKDGIVLDPEGFIICDAPMNQNYPTIAFNGTSYLVVWHDWRPNANQFYGSTYGARISPDGTVLDDPAFKIAGNRVRGQVPIQVTASGTGWLVVYMEEKDAAAKFRLSDVYGCRISQDGLVLDTQGIPVATAFGHQFGPVVGYGNGRYLVAWGDIFRHSGNAIYGQLLKEQQSEAMSPFRYQDEPVHSMPHSAVLNQMAADWITETTPAWFYGSKGTAFGAADSYAIGSGIYHYSETQWEEEVNGDKRYGLWVGGPNAIWVGGWSRAFYHYDGTSWTEAGSFSSHGSQDIVTAIWGEGATPLWATCDRGDMLSYDGISVWSTVPTGVPFDLADLWGTSANNIYAVGERGTILHYTGTTWSAIPGIPTMQTLNAIWGSGPYDIFVVGDWGTVIHYDGTNWNLQDSGTAGHLFGVWGSGSADVYAVGFNGTILHYDGSSWKPDGDNVDQDLLAVWGALDLSEETQTVWASGYDSEILKKTIPITVYHEYLPLVIHQ